MGELCPPILAASAMASYSVRSSSAKRHGEKGAEREGANRKVG